RSDLRFKSWRTTKWNIYCAPAPSN
uniref:Uncharacterized protein n=1 Tax=Megaselia scalaris TaxID=36166 RepID=T1H6Q3_MEGSC